MQFTILRGLMATCLAAALPAATFGQELTRSISVVGKGEVKVAPTTVELTGTLGTEAELAGDALTKFRSAKQGALDAVQKLAIENLTVEVTGFSFGSPDLNRTTTQILLGRQQGVEPVAKVQVQESVRLRLTKIDKLERDKVAELLVRLIDTAKEAGVTFGPPANTVRLSSSRDEAPILTFSITDNDAARAQAESIAMQDARQKAERLAKLSGGQLLDVRSVQSADTPYVYSSSGLRTSVTNYQASKFDDIEVTVTLQVTYGMRGP